MNLSQATISALSYSIVTEECLGGRISTTFECNRVVRFIFAQCQAMPDFLRGPLWVLTLLFAVQSLAQSGRWFHQRSHSKRWQQVLAWKHSRFGFRRDLIYFYESLSLVSWFETPGEPTPAIPGQR